MASITSKTKVLGFPYKAFGVGFWTGLAVVFFVTLTVAAVFWMSAHPYGTNWDETNYLNRMVRDMYRFEQYGLGRLLQVWVGEDTSRPPAFRVIAFPAALLFGPNPMTLRLVSWMSLGITSGFIYLTARRIAGPIAGSFAVIYWLACPIIIGPNMRFYVDYPMLLAIAATLYFLFVDWDRQQPTRWGWIGMGCALGLAGLAKPTAVLVLGPMMLLALVLGWRKVIQAPTPRLLIQSWVIAVVLMLPWWGFNYRAAISKAFRSGGNIRDALGPPGAPETLLRWLYVFSQAILGPALTLLTFAILATLVFRLARRTVVLNRAEATALLMCAAGAVPIALIAMFGTNHNPRLISPLLIPLAIGMAIAASKTRWLEQRGLAAIATVILCFQLAVMVSPTPGDPRYQAGDAAAATVHWGNPTTVMQREEQWDWSQLKAITDSRGLERPQLAYIGNANPLNPTQISSAWVQDDEPVDVEWLWSYIIGDIDWDQVMESAREAEVVFTFSTTESAQDYVISQDPDNQNNAEFIARLRQDSSFEDPIQIPMGRFEPVQLFVFLKKR